AILARFSKADEAHLYLVEGPKGGFLRRASFGSEGSPVGKLSTAKLKKLAAQLSRSDSFDPARATGAVALDPTWPDRFATCWSVPMISDDHVAGVIQFGFN